MGFFPVRRSMGLSGLKTEVRTAMYHTRIPPGHRDTPLLINGTGTLQVVDGTEIRTEEWEPSRGGYQHFYENVRQAITGESELAVRPEQAALVMRLIELCRKSAVEGRTLDVDL
jgi:predicted dehydrogenase